MESQQVKGHPLAQEIGTGTATVAAMGRSAEEACIPGLAAEQGPDVVGSLHRIVASSSHQDRTDL